MVATYSTEHSRKDFSHGHSDALPSIGIVGLGYVGLPLGIAFARVGCRVVGFDTDRDKVAAINQGRSYISHISDDDVAEISRHGGTAVMTPKELAQVDAILICVPTPLTKNREPNTAFIENVAGILSYVLRKGQLVCVESTTYPGTTRDVLLPIMEQGGLVGGSDFCVAYSPEREDPGVMGHSARDIPKVVGGLTQDCLRAARKIYDLIVPRTVSVSSLEVAEASKLMENIFRCVNIGLVNELKIVLARMGVDIWEVVDAAATKPFGYMPFYPGPGLGGHCIPIDPFYLSWRAREYQSAVRFIDLAGEINVAMPEYVIARTAEELNRERKSLNGSRVLVVGLAYKPNVDDLRESPSMRIMQLLQESGAAVDYHDPHVPVFSGDSCHKLLPMRSAELVPERLREYDAVVIATNHDSIDYELLGSSSSLIIDTRNAMKRIEGSRTRITKA